MTCVGGCGPAEADEGRPKKQKRDRKRDKEARKEKKDKKKRQERKESGSSEEEEEEESDAEQRGGRKRGGLVLRTVLSTSDAVFSAPPLLMRLAMLVKRVDSNPASSVDLAGLPRLHCRCW